MTTANEQNPAPRRRTQRVRLALAMLTTILLVLLLSAVAASRLPMWGAELFGGLAKKIKGNPGATTVISLSAGAALWLAIGLLAAAQEWLARRRSVPKRP